MLVTSITLTTLLVAGPVDVRCLVSSAAEAPAMHLEAVSPARQLRQPDPAVTV